MPKKQQIPEDHELQWVIDIIGPGPGGWRLPPLAELTEQERMALKSIADSLMELQRAHNMSRSQIYQATLMQSKERFGKILAEVLERDDEDIERLRRMWIDLLDSYDEHIITRVGDLQIAANYLRQKFKPRLNEKDAFLLAQYVRRLRT